MSLKFRYRPHDVSELEKHFSDLYQSKKTIDEIALDLVIMSPEELTVVEDDMYSESEIYVLEEDWDIDGVSGGNVVEAYTDFKEAQMNMRKKLRDERIEGVISLWSEDKDRFDVTSSENNFEIYEVGFYNENHYSILIRKEKLKSRRTTI